MTAESSGAAPRPWRARSLAWRRVLGPRAAFTFGDVGACGCASGATICVKPCTSGGLAGASVAIRSGGSTGPLVFEGTTGSNGCVAVPVSGAGYYVTASYDGNVGYAGSPTIPAGGTLTLSGDPAGYGVVCCGSYTIPMSLTATDAAGSFALGYDASASGSYGYPIWDGGHDVQLPSGGCFWGSTSTGPVAVCYQVACNAGSFSAQRSWPYSYDAAGSAAAYYQAQGGIVPGSGCVVAPPPQPNCNGGVDVATGTASPSSGSPFAASFPMAPGAANVTADPVGGTLAVSA